ncbi:uncharacterized protein FFB14_08585 [Fusarium fujikuroi]|nr:uncharacterized protein FFB14_08585 [Fusarium fujikuroi]
MPSPRSPESVRKWLQDRPQSSGLIL